MLSRHAEISKGSGIGSGSWVWYKGLTDPDPVPKCFGSRTLVKSYIGTFDTVNDLKNSLKYANTCYENCDRSGLLWTKTSCMINSCIFLANSKSVWCFLFPITLTPVQPGPGYRPLTTGRPLRLPCLLVSGYIKRRDPPPRLDGNSTQKTPQWPFDPD